MEVEQILSDLIKIPSVNPPGGETQVALYLKKLFDGAGIKNEIIESAPGRGNFLAYLGQGEKSLLFFSHTDVVPPGEGWDFEPFSGEIKGGTIYGRGALDCKGLVAAQAQVMLELAKRPLTGRLIFATVADEEAGGNYGAGFLAQNHLPKIAADFVVNEGGQEPIKLNGRMAYFIQVGEKGVAWTKLRSRGTSCHGSMPTLGDNAVAKMARAITSLYNYKPKIRLSLEVKTLIQTFAQHQGWGRITTANVDAFLNQWPDRQFAEYLRSITRMTVSPNFVHGGTKTNVVPDSCQADVDIRILPGQDDAYVLTQLSSLLSPEIEIDLHDYHPASFSPTSPGYQAIEQGIKRELGDVLCLPCISAGATDSRFLRDKGITSYGISLLDPNHDPAIRGTFHAKNERIDIQSLRLNVSFLRNLALTYLNS